MNTEKSYTMITNLNIKRKGIKKQKYEKIRSVHKKMRNLGRKCFQPKYKLNSFQTIYFDIALDQNPYQTL